MSDNDLETIAGSETTATEEALGLSLLRQAEKNREERTNTLFLDVPSWSGDLIAEYRTQGRSKLEGMARKILQESKAGSDSSIRTAADIDFILAANVGLYAYNAEGGEREEDRRVPIPVDPGGPAVPYGQFGEVQQRIRPDQPAPRSAREVVLNLFAKKGEDPSVAISSHALVIARWMRDPSKPVTLEDLG